MNIEICRWFYNEVFVRIEFRKKILEILDLILENKKKVFGKYKRCHTEFDIVTSNKCIITMYMI